MAKMKGSVLIYCYILISKCYSTNERMFGGCSVDINKTPWLVFIRNCEKVRFSIKDNIWNKHDNEFRCIDNTHQQPEVYGYEEQPSGFGFDSFKRSGTSKPSTRLPCLEKLFDEMRDYSQYDTNMQCENYARPMKDNDYSEDGAIDGAMGGAPGGAVQIVSIL